MGAYNHIQHQDESCTDVCSYTTFLCRYLTAHGHPGTYRSSEHVLISTTITYACSGTCTATCAHLMQSQADTHIL